MCYYNGVKVTRKELIRLLQMEAAANESTEFIKSAQSGFEFSAYPIIKPLQGGAQISLQHAEWGFLPDSDLVCMKTDIPAFRKESTALNAQDEKLLKSTFYRDAALNRRCLVSSGFYDFWHYKPRGGKKEEPYPYHVTVPGRDPISKACHRVFLSSI